MRIAYLLMASPGPESGVFKKIRDQIKAWNASSNETRVFMLSHKNSSMIGQNCEAPVTVERWESTWRQFTQVERLVKVVLNWRPDLVYLRYEGYYPALSRLACATLVVAEINGDDIEVSRLLATKRRYWYNRITRGWLLSKVKGMVFLSEELSKLARFARYGKLAAVIGNSVDLSRYPPLPSPSNAAPRLVFLGTPAVPWYGIDKILWLASRFPAWNFDLIGISAEHLDAVAPPNVVLHGFLEQSRYEPIIADADVAIGTLAWHRKRLNEASTLKVREYLAYGIPTIIGYEDTDFPNPVPYLLQLPNTPDNVMTHAETIRYFVEAVKGTRVPRDQVSHLDVRFKEAERLRFFQTVVDSA